MDRRAPEILLITPQVEPTVAELTRLLEAEHSIHIDCSNPVKVQGQNRRRIDRIRYYWLDPLLTMIRLAPRVWRYRLVITYYHRNGYWLGILGRLFRRRRRSKWVWVGFAPNPARRGVLGWIKETVTYSALLGHDVIVCNSRPVIDAIRQRFPKVADRLGYARWGGGGERTFVEPVDRGYIFCGGRTNRDFATVLEAVSTLGCPAIFVAGMEETFPKSVPAQVTILRDISSDEFQRLVREARVVVLALKRPDISSGQVVLSRAMQSGKPIVVSAIAGIDDYVTPGKDALLVAPGSVDDLKAKLTWLLENPRRRAELGAAARLTFERSFNSKVFAEQLFGILTATCQDLWAVGPRSGAVEDGGHG